MVMRFFERNVHVLAAAFVFVGLASVVSAADVVKVSTGEKKVIGPTALVEEMESDFKFAARVDTGATTSSMHVEECKVEDAAGKMDENLGKTIHFKIKNTQGGSEWLKREIAEISTIKTSEREEVRYKVPITLNVKDVKKRVLVSLNDRSHMTYPVLLGRNFLQGDFVVDVDLGEKLSSEQKASADEPAKQQEPSKQPAESRAKDRED